MSPTALRPRPRARLWQEAPLADRARPRLWKPAHASTTRTSFAAVFIRTAGAGVEHEMAQDGPLPTRLLQTCTLPLPHTPTCHTHANTRPPQPHQPPPHTKRQTREPVAPPPPHLNRRQTRAEPAFRFAGTKMHRVWNSALRALGWNVRHGTSRGLAVD